MIRSGDIHPMRLFAMKSISWKLLLGFWMLVLSFFFTLSPPLICAKQSSDKAYVTLLYGDEFLLGVRVLGKSIRDTGSTKDMVALVSDGVSDNAKNLLKGDDWIVEPISLLANPNKVRPQRFWGVYTKLKIFNMTNYKKVVYLDADTIVVKSIEDLFKCGKFCANLKHSERLNSGVMVVEPSAAVFGDMMSKVNTLHSYTGGDQGFLNSYYNDFPNAHLFEPNIPQEVVDSKPSPEMERLSTLYNADVGLYMLANKNLNFQWMVDESKLHVIHYTLGPLKPWDWWTSWLLKPVDVWQNARVKLEESLPGTSGGRNPADELIVKLLFVVPIFTFLFCYYQSILQTRSLADHFRHIFYTFRFRTIVSYSAVASPTLDSNQHVSLGSYSKVPPFLGGLSVSVCFVSVVVALGVSLMIIPRQVMPWTGLLLMYEWTFTIFILLFGCYLHLVHQWGKKTSNQLGSISPDPESVEKDSSKGHQTQGFCCDDVTLYYGLGMAVLAIVAPSLPCLLGITALFLRLGMMVAGGIFLASFMTYASEHLGIRSFLKGLDDRNGSRKKNSFTSTDH
ncbi:inositol phosphorylceramide glucuronosyltransferase 1-like isoform X2 [Impatiens glandulifera]|uniref:inositol phosphorylceramide glucuronosyltransferase 1-like isoform X2 n=1 Tax=Impatiens glandulifera TaxID=253017 RepID=UPI001FB07050|nr:inositol phosphorylceramide glucuronosyltransferase 1-like isoform X2 [Impatiens glandulifera]